MTHYETLGVPPDASEGDIKAAYRRRAKAAHPDKGGDAEEMAKINDAYAVLSDPARRIAYDCGAGEQGPSIEEQARAGLTDLMRAHLADRDVLTSVRAKLRGHESMLVARRAELTRKRKTLEAKKGKVRTRTGVTNVHAMLLEAAVRSVDAELAAIAQQMEVNACAAKMLEDYSEEVEMPSSLEAMLERDLRRAFKI